MSSVLYFSSKSVLITNDSQNKDGDSPEEVLEWDRNGRNSLQKRHGERVTKKSGKGFRRGHTEKRRYLTTHFASITYFRRTFT